VRSLMMVTAPTHVGVILMEILVLILKQKSSASVGEKRTSILSEVYLKFLFLNRIHSYRVPSPIYRFVVLE
jgi:hypothetical protein